jgi:hypothetical protein
MSSKFNSEQISKFFANCMWLDSSVLRPLSHIAPNWEASWDGDNQCYKAEADSFADDLNAIITQIANTENPMRYHDNEDNLAERVLRDLNWPIQKKGNFWSGADYQSILEQGSFDDIEQQNLITAATGRVQTAMELGQMHFDDMEQAHLNILAAIMTIAIYQRDNDGVSLLFSEECS